MTTPLGTVTPLQRIQEALLDAGSRRSGASNWTCPAHDDRHPSLSVHEGDDGRALINCHSGCAPEDVVAALRLRMADLYPPHTGNGNGPHLGLGGGLGGGVARNGNGAGRGAGKGRGGDQRVIVTAYDYASADGELLYQVVRYLPKGFRQRRPDGNGGWIWRLGDTPRVLYRLPEVLAAVADGREVWVVEGERDVHTLESVGVVATCNPMGAGKWRPEYTRTLAGATVTVVADADDTGRAHAVTVAEALRGAGCTVRVVQPAVGKDATDHLATRALDDFVAFSGTPPADSKAKSLPTDGAGPTEPGGDSDEDANGEIDADPDPAWGVGEARLFPVVDLAELARNGVPPPSFVCDVLYRGGLHSLAGPPDCGKSTILYYWMLLLLAQGERVVLLDEESGREQVVEKLLALGAEPRHLERLAYVEYPARAWDLADVAGLARLLDTWRPALLGFDSAAAFLAQAGKDENAAPDVTSFYKEVMLQAARNHGVAVVVLDHLGKDQVGGRYSRGSSAKLATVDVGFMLELIAPFSRQQSGQVNLAVSKDRRGYLHRDYQVHIAVEDGAMALDFVKVAEQGGSLSALSPAARKILFTLRNLRGAVTVRQLGDAYVRAYGTGLRRPTISTELNNLAEAGLVEAVDSDIRGTKLWLAIPEGGTDGTAG